MEDFEEMDFGEETGTAMGDKAKDRLKNRLNALSKTENYCRATVTEDCEANNSDFGEGARCISFRMEGTNYVFGGCTCTKEEYELLRTNYNISDTLVGTKVEVIMDASGLIFGIR